MLAVETEATDYDMTDKSIVRLTVTYDTGSRCFEIDSVCTAKVFEEIIEEWQDVSKRMVFFTGKLNDIDNNDVQYAIESDCIKSVVAMAVNGI